MVSKTLAVNDRGQHSVLRLYRLLLVSGLRYTNLTFYCSYSCFPINHINSNMIFCWFYSDPNICCRSSFFFNIVDFYSEIYVLFLFEFHMLIIYILLLCGFVLCLNLNRTQSCNGRHCMPIDNTTCCNL